MSSILCGVKIRLRPQSLVRMLIGVAYLRVILALPVGSGVFEASLAATAVSGLRAPLHCSSLLFGIGTSKPATQASVRYSVDAPLWGFTGALLPNVSLLSFARVGSVPALAAALAGLALTLLSAIALEWLLRDIEIDQPHLSESVVMARLTALMEQAEFKSFSTPRCYCATRTAPVR